MVILFALLLLPASACIWVEGSNLAGEHRRIEGTHPDQRLTEALLTDPEEKLDLLADSPPPPESDTASLKEREGVKELLSGNYDRAIGLLQQIEADHPGRYSTAANLGTAYELQDDLESALKWIQEGVRRNPDSHHGSEWLHVEILKARIELRNNPSYLHDRRLIPLPETFTDSTPISVGGHTHTAQAIGEAIFYQLQERLVFVKDPDPVIADLMFTFGRIEGRVNVIESGKRLLQMTRRFGFPRPALITREIDIYDKAIADAKTRKTIRTILSITLALAAFTAFIIFAWKTKRFCLTRKAHNQHRATMA
ncbi:MAG: hypothetical protein EOP85_15560 [Verrucomicrobiaceae bacterium]|nr:MAG: hypothetical protein EOP85_15560 [Verrucomicrobiaceae bacterium]